MGGRLAGVAGRISGCHGNRIGLAVGQRCDRCGAAIGDGGFQVDRPVAVGPGGGVEGGAIDGDSNGAARFGQTGDDRCGVVGLVTRGDLGCGGWSGVHAQVLGGRRGNIASRIGGGDGDGVHAIGQGSDGAGATHGDGGLQVNTPLAGGVSLSHEGKAIDHQGDGAVGFGGAYNRGGVVVGKSRGSNHWCRRGNGVHHEWALGCSR